MFLEARQTKDNEKNRRITAVVTAASFDAGFTIRFPWRCAFCGNNRKNKNLDAFPVVHHALSFQWAIKV
ncbi:MAG: hypothetical protein LBU45_00785, partial [Azoarcus sp.]|nr:hypothetical protein [Azoarcus sp.]